jgi:hypothetical protein
MDAPRRLLIPARRTASREVLRPVIPFFLRDLGSVDPAAAAPPLLSFASDAFVDDFLAVAGDRRTLPNLLPWRDWSEPPDVMLDGSGQPDYPASIDRALPLAVVPESGTGIDPDGIPTGSPRWLRKLYLPLHERFTMLAFDMICRAPGWPRLDRARVLGSGAVIRRLVGDPANERWQDWIAIDDKQGLWLELLDTDLRPASGDAPVDPARLPEAVLTPHEARLRALLDRPAPAPLAIGLTSAPLSLLPPDTGRAAEHCTLFGYLPVFSGAREAIVDPYGDQGVAAIAARLADETRTTLEALFAGVGGLRAAAEPHLRQILELALLPVRPTATQLANARTAITGFAGSVFSPPPDVDSAIARAVDRTLRHVLRLLLDHGASTAVRDAEIGGTVATGQGFWVAAGAPDAATAPGLGSAWIRDNMLALTARWDTLVRERLHQVCTGWLATATVAAPAVGSSSELTARDLWTVMLLALLRLRGCRMALAAHLSLAVGWGDASERLTELDDDGHPVSTAGGLGEEIEAILALEAERGDPRSTPPWPALTFGGLADHQRVLDAHRAGVALSEVYAAIDQGLADAGGATALQLQASTEDAANQINTVLALSSGLDPLRARGASLREQPASGLLVVPGYAADPTFLAGFVTAAASRYTAEPQALALPEARRRDKTPRLRFDADHLYAVWAWVRVAGRDPCEPERVLWTPRGEPFSIADPTDLLGARPANIKMPDIPKLLRDLPRLGKAQANPFAAVASPDQSGVLTGEDMDDTRRDWGIGFICSFGIPVLTICALILFNIIFHILIVLPGFAWMLLLKICIPFPRRGS